MRATKTACRSREERPRAKLRAPMINGLAPPWRDFSRQEVLTGWGAPESLPRRGAVNVAQQLCHSRRLQSGRSEIQERRPRFLGTLDSRSDLRSAGNDKRPRRTA